MTYIMTKCELQQNRASLKALETVERLLRGLSYDDSEPDPRLQGTDSEIAQALRIVNNAKCRIMDAVNADLGRFEERKGELEPLLKRCTDRIFENKQTVEREKTALKNRLRRDEREIARMKGIGMSDKKIALVYSPISQEEISEIETRLAKLETESERLKEFVADFPRYDMALLEGVAV